MRKTPFWIGLLGGCVATILIGLFAVPAFGIIGMDADQRPGILDWWGEMNMQSALMWRAEDEHIPEDANLKEGLEHYRSSCLLCHGAPHVDSADWGRAMLPAPPHLWSEDTQHLSDGKLFHIVSHGVRMTGMPAFGEEHSNSDIWNIVAVVRHLNDLTDDQQKQLAEAAEKFRHHEAGGHHHTSAEDAKPQLEEHDELPPHAQPSNKTNP